MTEIIPDFILSDKLTGNPACDLNALFAAAIAQNLAVAVWRLPQSQEIHLAVSLQPTLLSQLPELETSPPGFLFCPFEVSLQHPLHFIAADVTYSTTQGATNINVTLQKEEPDNRLRAFQVELQKKLHSPSPTSWYAGKTEAVSSSTKDQFVRMVEQGVTLIQAEEMEKVVLSRSKAVVLPAGFELLPVFQGLANSYPLAFVYLVSVPGSGTWMGASPETLVQVDQNRMFRTEALAGTQPFHAGNTPSEAIWRQKEIEEQSLVVRYIINCFKKIRLREYVETGPRTVVAGNLMHLRTDFKVNMTEVDFPRLATQMMQLLHPTSAVCGMPIEPAQRFIRENEGYPRGYYSGFMGPVRLQNETRLYVTLRCIQLIRNALILYAGAGVTGESVPEKEWQETEIKMETMLSVITQYT
jgi:isochorismate synthase